jgi:hypothetical protein
MFNIWLRAITQPRLATYQAFLEEEPNPTFGKAAGWVALAGLIAGFISGLLWLIFGSGLVEWGFTNLVCGMIAAPIGAVIGFLINSAILLAVAKVLGGEGTFDGQSYVLGAANAPMSIILAVLVLAPLPVVGTILVGFLASIYYLWLTALGLQAAHRYTPGRALVTLLAPVAILIAIACCTIALLTLMGPAVGEVFSTIVDEI